MAGIRPAAPRADAPTALALFIAAALPSLLAWWYFVGLAGDADSGQARKVVFGAGKVVEVALPLAFVLLWEHRLPRLRRPHSDGCVIGLGFGIVVAVGMLGAYYGWLRESPLLARAPAALLVVLRKFGIDTRPGFLAWSSFAVVANSFFEEYYFRWFLFGRLRLFVPFWAAVMLSALAFMAHHIILLRGFLADQFWAVAAPLSLCIAVGGGVWAWLYARTGSLYAPWISHAVVDAAVMVIGWDLAHRAV